MFLVNKDAALGPDTDDDVVQLAPDAPVRDCYAIWLRGTRVRSRNAFRATR